MILTAKRILNSINNRVICQFSKEQKQIVSQINLKILKQLNIKNADQIKSKIDRVEEKIKNFVDQFDIFAQITKKSPLDFTVLFARSCLISHKYINFENYYPIIKQNVGNQKLQLSPHTCTALIECFSYFSFEGDQNKVMQRLCKYYQLNHSLFTQNQQAIFWQNYMKIMGEKAHSSVKFYKINRKRQSTLQFSSIQQIAKAIIKQQKINKNIIKKISYDNKDQITIQIKGRHAEDKQMLIRLKGMTNFNDIQGQNIGGQLDHQIKSYIIDEIRFLNKRAQKGWNIIFHGRVQEPQQARKQKYIYTDKIDGKQLGYIGTQKIEQIYQIKPQMLNDQQQIQKLRISNRYVKGVFYNSLNLNHRRIDMFTTMILGLLNTQNLVLFLQTGCNNQTTKSTNTTIDYMTLYQLKQCYGYSKLCEFLWSIFQSYVQVQFILNSIETKKRQKKYDIQQIQLMSEQLNLQNSGTKQLLLQNSNQLANLTIDQSKQARNLRFQYEYNKDYQKLHNVIANYGSQAYWQVRPFFQDILMIKDIMHNLKKQKSRSKQKNIKILIITQRQNLPFLIKQLTQLKFQTVPIYRSSSQELQKKELIFRSLMKETKRSGQLQN